MPSYTILIFMQHNNTDPCYIHIYEKYRCWVISKEEELNIKLPEIEAARRNNNHRVGWQLINKLCGRRITREGQLKGKTQL